MNHSSQIATYGFRTSFSPPVLALAAFLFASASFAGMLTAFKAQMRTCTGSGRQKRLSP